MFAGCGEKAGQPQTDTTGSAQSVQQTGTLTATTTGITGGTSSAMEPADKEFVENAGAAGLAEVQMGNYALQKASSADVKAFAQRMVADHSKGNEELQELATAKGVALSAELHGDHETAMKKLKVFGDARFDNAYMRQMVEDHQKAVAMFENAASTAHDSDLKSWAAKTLPTLKEHLQLAQTVSSKLR